jgi:hypothetical protein
MNRFTMIKVLHICLLAAAFLYATVVSECDPSGEQGFSLALRAADWSCARSIADGDTLSYELLSRILDTEQRAAAAELAAIKAAIERKQVTSLVYLSPAFQWAQSPEEVFLSVKFSHKLDAPATLNVQHNLTLDNSRLLLIGSNGLKNFKLDLELLNEIVLDSSGWSSSSNGRITITLKKAATAKWGRLLRDNSKKPSNMHFWLDKQESYSDALEELERNEDKVKETAAGKKGDVGVKPTILESPPEEAKMESSKPSQTSFEELQAKARQDALNSELSRLEQEKKMRLADVNKRALAERKEIERDISARIAVAEKGSTPDVGKIPEEL